MSLKKSKRRKSSLVTELAIFHTVLFSSVLVVAALAFFLFLRHTIFRDIDRDLLEQAREFRSTFEAANTEKLIEEIEEESLSIGDKNAYFFLLHTQKGVLFQTPTNEWGGELVNRSLLNPKATFPLIETRKFFRAGEALNARVAYHRLDDSTYLANALSLRSDEDYLWGFILPLVGVLLFTVFFSSLFTHRVLANAVRRVASVTDTALKISEGRLEERVHLGGKRNEIYDLSRTFNKMLDKIQQTINGMRDMAENLAHELRTPLTRLRGSAELSLTRGETSSTASQSQTELAITVIEECDNLLTVIESVLDVAEAQAGVLELNKSEFSLSELAEKACELFQSLADEKEISIRFTGPSECIIRGDKTKLERAVSNLLDNAIKFSPKRSDIVVTLAIENSQIALEIRDFGAGIDSNELEKVFNRFFRGDHNQKSKGTGLGLTIVKSIVESHGGTVEVNSTKGQGASFTISLPRKS